MYLLAERSTAHEDKKLKKKVLVVKKYMTHNFFVYITLLFTVNSTLM
jgi:hypothetical protein